MGQGGVPQGDRSGLYLFVSPPSTPPPLPSTSSPDRHSDLDTTKAATTASKHRGRASPVKRKTVVNPTRRETPQSKSTKVRSRPHATVWSKKESKRHTARANEGETIAHTIELLDEQKAISQRAQRLLDLSAQAWSEHSHLRRAHKDDPNIIVVQASFLSGVLLIVGTNYGIPDILRRDLGPFIVGSEEDDNGVQVFHVDVSQKQEYDRDILKSLCMDSDDRMISVVLAEMEAEMTRRITQPVIWKDHTGSKGEVLNCTGDFRQTAAAKPAG